MWRLLYVKIEQAKEKPQTMHSICNIYGNQKKIYLLNQKLLQTSNKYKCHNKKLENEINKQLIKERVNCSYVKNCSAVLVKKCINFKNNEAHYQDPSYT